MDLETALPYLKANIKYARIEPCPSCQEIKRQKEKEKEAKKKEKEAKADVKRYKKTGKSKPKESQQEENTKPKEDTSTPEKQEKPVEKMPTKDKPYKPYPVIRQKYWYAKHILLGTYRSKQYPYRYPIRKGILESQN